MSEWISVEQRKPFVGEAVKAKGNGSIATAMLMTDNTWCIKLKNNRWANWLADVTHWMPLPDPPEADTP